MLRDETQNIILTAEVKANIESDYHIKIEEVKTLGEGDNGAVFRIKDASGVMRCIKKIPKDNPTVDSDFTIVKVMYDSPEFSIKKYTDGQHDYIVMPFFQGEDLNKSLMKNYPEFLREKILFKLVMAIDRMHRLGILHRDLKPQNIIVNIKNRDSEEEKDVDVYIIDFGRGVRIFDHITGKPLATPQSLSLMDTTHPKSWSMRFYPICQFFRKFQPQTAPELSTVSSHYLGYQYEAEGSGLRSDYYGAANLFLALLPEKTDIISNITLLEGHERTSAYRKFVEEFISSSSVRSGEYKEFIKQLNTYLCQLFNDFMKLTNPVPTTESARAAHALF